MAPLCPGWPPPAWAAGSASLLVALLLCRLAVPGSAGRGDLSSSVGKQPPAAAAALTVGAQQNRGHEHLEYLAHPFECHDSTGAPGGHGIELPWVSAAAENETGRRAAACGQLGV